MKYSKQREEILKIIQTENHPTAEKIFQEVQKEIPNISLATVYRNLNILLKQKFITKVNCINEKDRFDKIITPHSHMECMICKNIYDWEYTLPEKLKAEMQKKEEFKIDAMHIILTGVCLNCQKKEG